VIVWGQAMLLVLTVLLLYLLGARYFNPWTGALAGLLLVVQPHVLHLTFGTLASTIVVGFMVVASATMLLWSLSSPSVPRAGALGAVLGVSTLTGGATMPFVPFAALLLLASSRRLRRPALPPVLACVLAFGLVVSPWVLRNERVFGAFIPARTGLGQAMHVGYPMLAETFVPGLSACPDSSGPPWTASSAGAAIRQARVREPRRQIEHRSYACIDQLAVPGYAAMNEAQRDHVYLAEALTFVRAHPRVSAVLGVRKEVAFFYSGLKWYLRLLAALALVGAFLAVRRGPARILAMLVIGYSIPYVLGTPFFDRYRYPIEPLLLLFASYAVVLLATTTIRRLRGLSASSASSAETKSNYHRSTEGTQGNRGEDLGGNVGESTARPRG
jgi:4-amino-4-deoxy-L-arabinose transferase-like glycosyltransferase